MPKLYTPRDAAQVLGISYSSLKQWIYRGKLKTVQTPGGHHRIPESEIDRFLPRVAVSGSTAKRCKTFRRISGRNQLVGRITDIKNNPSNNADTRNPVRPFINPNFTGSAILGIPAQWFNPAAFLAPPTTSGFFGNAPRNNLVGPGLATWDFSTIKNTRLRESLTLKFRAEIFNLLNRANFNTPALITLAPAGVIGHGGSNHQHLDHRTPGTVRAEAVVVTPTQPAASLDISLLLQGD